MAASSIQVTHDIPIGATLRLYMGTFTPSTSYPTGGEPIDLPNNTRLVKMFTTGGGGYSTNFISSSQLLKVYRQKDPAAAGGADIALPEVGSTVDLSASTFEFFAIGS